MNDLKRKGIEYPMFDFCGIVHFEGDTLPVSQFMDNEGRKFVISAGRDYVYVEDVAEGVVRRKD